MDKQLALMKRYQKDENTIAYVHNGEIVLIKRENGTLFELIIDPKTEAVISSRTLTSSEMTVQQFDAIKKELTDTTNEDFNSEQRNTYRNVSYDAIGDNIELCTHSVEEEYISVQSGEQSADTLLHFVELLKAAKLTEIQLRRFVKHIYYKKSTRQIAKEEGASQSSIKDSIVWSKKKLKKYFAKLKK